MPSDKVIVVLPVSCLTSLIVFPTLAEMVNLLSACSILILSPANNPTKSPDLTNCSFSPVTSPVVSFALPAVMLQPAEFRAVTKSPAVTNLFSLPLFGASILPLLSVNVVVFTSYLMLP